MARPAPPPTVPRQIHPRTLRIFETTDCSGFALGGVLSQEVGRVRKPVAFHSQKLGKSELNYDIHDKELLAIVRCMEQWDAELRSCSKFTVLSDHKNLEYFMTKRSLSERQARWAECLSRYSFSLVYRPGKDAILPDALSRREQDGIDEHDKKSRVMRLIPSECTTNWTDSTQINALKNQKIFEKDLWNQKWWETVQGDSVYNAVLHAKTSGERDLPHGLGLKIQLSDCSIEDGLLRHRGRLWIPGAPYTTEAEWKGGDSVGHDMDLLRTWILQACHDSAISGHPGREGLMSSTGRDYYWPLISLHIRRFCRNCDSCGRSKIWRNLKHGLLQPLPVPDRFFSEISMDFMTDLPLSGGCRYLWVIKDRLSKTVTLEATSSMKAPECARKFLDCWVRHHGFPRAITSDRGSNWTSRFWTHLCSLLGVSQRLSTAYHPQTDGGPERMNQEIQAYLRTYINHEQTDWKNWLPAAQLAINGRHQISIGMSPFFATHGYHPQQPIAEATDATRSSPNSDKGRAEAFASKIREITETCQAQMAASTQKQEESANKKRNPATTYRVGDKVWLDLRNYSTDRPKRSLDFKHAKYTVSEVLSPASVRLSGLPRNMHAVFHTDPLRLASNDPLPGQENDDNQPDPILVEGHQEYHIERIVKVKEGARAGTRDVLVKWTGYNEPSWEPRANVVNTDAWTKYASQVATQ